MQRSLTEKLRQLQVMSQKHNEYRRLLKNGLSVEAARLAERQYLENNADNPFWLTRQAAALTRAKKYDQAFKIANQSLLIDPSDPYSILAVAQALQGLNRFKEAIQYFEEITETPKLSFYARKGVFDCLLIIKQWDSILDLLGKWEMPSATSFRWRVKALEGKKRFAEAFEACRRWLETDPDNPVGLWSLTELEIRRDGLESVLSRMGKIAKIGSRPPIYKEIYASLCRRAGKPELALKQYEKIAQSGSKTRIHRKRAFVLAQSGKEPEAIGLMEELLKIDPNDFYIHSSYKAACGRVRQLDRALKFYEGLVELFPEEKSLYGRIREVKKRLAT